MAQCRNAPGEPCSDHPMTIMHSASRAVVHAGGRVIADTREAFEPGEFPDAPVARHGLPEYR